MKRGLLAVLAILLILGSIPVHAEKRLKIESTSVIDSDGLMNVRVRNTGPESDVTVSAVIQELGTVSSRSQRLHPGEKYTAHVIFHDLEAFPKGEYDVRVVARNGKERRVKHRLIIIE